MDILKTVLKGVRLYKVDMQIYIIENHVKVIKRLGERVYVERAKMVHFGDDRGVGVRVGGTEV
jgi:hypothetical protein